MSAAVWGGNGSGGRGCGYRGGLDHGPEQPSRLRSLLGGLDDIVVSYGDVYGLHLGKVGFAGGNVAGQGGQGFHSPFIVEPVVIPIARPVSALVAGGASWTALMDNDQLATGGANAWGQLGNDSNISGPGVEGSGSADPVYLETPPIIGICHGGANVGAITADGETLVWGEGIKGQLGQGSKMPEVGHPIVVPGLRDVVELDVGGLASLGSHFLALMEDHTVQGWGWGVHGELGEDLLNVMVPRPIPGLADIVEVSAGTTHSLFRTSDGRVLGLGANSSGELGLDPTVTGDHVLTPVEILLPGPAEAISAGYRFSIVLIGGYPYVFGWNFHRTLGDNSTVDSRWNPTPMALEGVREICAGELTGAALLSGAVPTPKVTAHWSSPGELTLRWQGTPRTKYRLGLRHQALSWHEREEWSLEGIPATQEAREHTFAGLTPGLPYEWQVQGAGLGACVGEGVAV